jgi:hypothetical protein
MTALPSHPSPVTPTMQARAVVGARAITDAVCPGRLQQRCCYPHRRQWCLVSRTISTSTASALMPLPTAQPCLSSSLPRQCSSPISPRWMCPGPLRRSSPLQAHQQHKLHVQQLPSPPLLCSGPLPLQSLFFWLQGCLGKATTLASLCRQVE